MKELGELMRAARQQRGLSLEEVTAETRIRRQYLQALEDGDFHMFPGPAYAVGFLRNYAICLGLNVDEVLQTYHALSPTTVTGIQPASTVAVERMRRRSRRRVKWGFAALLAVILIAAALAKYSNQPHTASPARLPVSTSGLPSPGARHHVTNSATADLAPQTHLRLPIGVVGVRASRTAWVHVVVNHRQVYWGPIQAGTYQEWSGRKVKVTTRQPQAFRVWVNNKQAGLLGNQPGRAGVVAHPGFWSRLP